MRSPSFVSRLGLPLPNTLFKRVGSSCSEKEIYLFKSGQLVQTTANTCTSGYLYTQREKKECA
ncbi:uncharacterized protein B0P05DRAFT_561617, partial [Gilbertella persicaria]|uniref:uncharacterized protein n=1 Tax=Gilbertella persicaria TaxID=101096 RepID=UPI00221ED7DD